ncbi:MAG: CDP-alcohol phosphatidyltransferase family protein [Actinomycetota bacterium]
MPYEDREAQRAWLGSARADPGPPRGFEPHGTAMTQPVATGSPPAPAERAEEEVSNRVLTVPNLISAARLCLVPILLWGFLTQRDMLGFVLLAVVGGTDWVDGYVARHTGQVSRLGKLLDPVADRVAIVAVLAALVARDAVPWPLGAAVIGRDVIVAIAFAVLETKGVQRIAVNFVGKAATLVLYAGMGLAAMSLVLPGRRPFASDVQTAAVVTISVGAVLYWIAGVLYVREIRALDRTGAG